MDSITNYYGYIISVIILSLTPGSDTVYILTKSIAGGFKSGIVSVAGITLGLFFHTFFASVGLSVIIMTSSVLFNIVKFAGALYLIYLGIMALKSRDSILLNGSKSGSVSYKKIFYQGFFTNILNPKVALFFLALIPQFIKNGTSSPVPFLILGITFIVIGSLWSICLVLFSSKISERLRKERFSKILNKLSGLVFITLGLNILRIKN